VRSLGARLALAVLLAVLGALLLAPLRAAVSPGSAPTALAFDAAERARIGELGPWPPAVPRDASNRVSGHRSAIAFGEVLFHSARLSSVGGLRCASCHEPWRSFTDARALGLGAAQGGRNTMSLLNVGLQHEFGWDGANDSLWAQSIRPLLDPREMRMSPAQAAALLRDDPQLAALYQRAFGSAPSGDDDAVLADIGKALAAYEETLVSERTPFDAFRDAIASGDRIAAARYPIDAQRGLRVFAGAGQCVACHGGANFSDGRFHRSRIASMLPDGEPDSGRRAGAQHLLASRFNLLGRFNDDARRTTAAATRDAAADIARSGEFRTPSLRDVAATGPFMHDGSVANLCDAIAPHASMQASDPVELSLAQRRDVVAFLRSLSVEPQPPHVDAAVFRCR